VSFQFNIKPEEFYLPQSFNEDQLNSEVAEDLVKTVCDISNLSDKCYTIFDYCKKEFIYISANSDLFNIKRNNQKKGYNYLIDNFDNEDVFLMLQFQKKAYRFLLTQKLEERVKYVFSMVVRIKSTKGEVDVIYKVKPQVLDKKGNIWLSIATLEKTNKYILPQVRNIETDQIHFFKPSDINRQLKHSFQLTKQEQKVLTLLAEGLLPSNICTELNIKEPTYKRHRAEIYRKLDVNNRIKAINKAYYLGILNNYHLL
jgi:DNA-binding CsgD family transcriptional regulator